MKQILIVDDEPQILKSLARVFTDTEYCVKGVKSGADALDLVKSDSYDLVISDMRMPEMDGYQLLKKIKALDPGTSRIMLSGYADENLVLNAMQQNVAWMYVFKPWNNGELIETVSHLLQTKDLLNEVQISRYSDADTTGLFPMQDQNTSGDVLSAAEQNPQFAQRILEVANNAFYRVQVNNARQAIGFLGAQNVRLLIQIIAASLQLPAGTNSFMDALIRHAQLTNRITTMIFEEFHSHKMPEISYMAGLLHNIGHLILLKEYGSEYMGLFDHAGEACTLQLEKAKYGVCHQNLGGSFLYWNEMPFQIVETALYHHNPFEKKIINSDLLLGVHIAQKYAGDIVYHRQLCPFEESAFDALSVGRDKFEKLLADNLQQGA